MSDWKIAAWSRELGRGSIESSWGKLDFDGGVSLASDYVVGEAVHVDLRGEGDSFRVLRIWPDEPAFMRPFVHPGAVPALASGLAADLERKLESLPVAFDYAVQSWSGELLTVIGGDDLTYGHDTVVEFRSVRYTELPAVWGGKSFRLADETERSYLATRVEIDTSSAAIRIVSDDDKIYFVVCEGLSWTGR